MLCENDALLFKNDKISQKALETAGFTVLRFADDEVLNNIQAVYSYVED